MDDPHGQIVHAIFLSLICAYAASAHADAGIELQRAQLQREQQSDGFALQLRQSQQLLNVGGAARQKAEMLNMEQRQRLQNLGESQLLQLPTIGQGAAPYEAGLPVNSGYRLQRFEQERRRQVEAFDRQR